MSELSFPGEPSLADLIGDPILSMMMRTDGVTAQALWAAIRTAQCRLDGSCQQPHRTPDHVEERKSRLLADSH
jgi:hypothetical protein